jgi:hypothetical protein
VYTLLEIGIERINHFRTSNIKDKPCLKKGYILPERIDHVCTSNKKGRL